MINIILIMFSLDMEVSTSTKEVGGNRRMSFARLTKSLRNQGHHLEREYLLQTHTNQNVQRADVPAKTPSPPAGSTRLMSHRLTSRDSCPRGSREGFVGEREIERKRALFVKRWNRQIPEEKKKSQLPIPGEEGIGKEK